MKRFFVVLIALAMLMTAFVGCTPVEKEVVLPPVRWGPDTGQDSRPLYSFEEAYAKSEVVARIKVGNWVSESEDLFHSFFEATVLECFKGDIPTEFTLAQKGYSDMTMKGYPLFTYGNELLLFLNSADEPQFDTPLYWILGSHTTVLYVSYDNSGNRYYQDRQGVLSLQGIPIPNVTDNKTLSEVCATAAEKDPIWDGSGFPKTYSEPSVLELINKQ